MKAFNIEEFLHDLKVFFHDLNIDFHDLNIDFHDLDIDFHDLDMDFHDLDMDFHDLRSEFPDLSSGDATGVTPKFTASTTVPAVKTHVRILPDEAILNIQLPKNGHSRHLSGRYKSITKACNKSRRWRRKLGA